MIVAYRVQLALPLDRCEDAQDYLDATQPGVWAFYPEPGALRAELADPYTPAYAVASGRVNAAEYAVLAAGAAALELSHLPIAHWEIQGGIEVEIPIENPASLFEAMGLVPVEDPEEED
jgi:hypothetical protein